MYYVKKRIEVSAAHRLRLDYPSKCTVLHGHNWVITVECRAEQLNACGMVVDFTRSRNSSSTPWTTASSTTSSLSIPRPRT